MQRRSLGAIDLRESAYDKCIPLHDGSWLLIPVKPTAYGNRWVRAMLHHLARFEVVEPIELKKLAEIRIQVRTFDQVEYTNSCNSEFLNTRHDISIYPYVLHRSEIAFSIYDESLSISRESPINAAEMSLANPGSIGENQVSRDSTTQFSSFGHTFFHFCVTLSKSHSSLLVSIYV